MGKRFIDADKLALKWMIASPKERKTFRQIIDEEPAADVVEVVRCKDCDYSIKMDSFGNYRCLVSKGIMRGRDFCSYGILKENE